MSDNENKNEIEIVNESAQAEQVLEATETKPAKKAKQPKQDKKKSKKITCDMPELKKTTIGGQALIEGVMMVGPRRTCIAVRKGDGTIHVEELPQTEKVSYFETVPFIRGCIRFYKMLVTGTGALMKSADISEEGKPEEQPKEGEKKSLLDRYFEKHYNVMITLSAIIGIILSVGIFLLLPKVIVDIVARYIVDEVYNTVGVSILLNLIEGFLRIMFFFMYLVFASKLEDVNRVWKYHGAEHKTIACYEAGMPLTPENVMKFPRFHPRCGTAFMFIVMAISILIYTLAGVVIGEQSMLINVLLRVILVPLICGISYEILRFVGRHDKNPFCRFLSKPGMWLQNFTTDEPDARICEVAIASMMAVIPENAEEDVW